MLLKKGGKTYDTLMREIKENHQLTNVWPAPPPQMENL